MSPKRSTSAAAVAPPPVGDEAPAIEQPMPPCTWFAFDGKQVRVPLLASPHRCDWQSLSEPQLAPTPPEPADEGGIGGADDVGGVCVPPEGDGGVLDGG
jgi:hypothetical protein